MWITNQIRRSESIQGAKGFVPAKKKKKKIRHMLRNKIFYSAFAEAVKLFISNHFHSELSQKMTGENEKMVKW